MSSMQSGSVIDRVARVPPSRRLFEPWQVVAVVGGLLMVWAGLALSAQQSGSANAVAANAVAASGEAAMGQGAGAEPFAVDELVERVATRHDPTQTYALYLPPGYPGEPSRRWPLLLVFDPRGQATSAAKLFLPAARELGWIVVSSYDTRSDGPMEPNQRALNALWPEAHQRFASDPRRLYASGFSGGAMVAYSLGQGTGQLAGVIVAGGRFEPSHYKTPIAFACFGAVGDTDFNYREMRAVHAQLAQWKAPERLEVFTGRHTWMPVELASLGLGWLEAQAMLSGLRERDGALAARLYAAEMAAAKAGESSGRLLEARRKYAAAVATFTGLTNVDTALQAVARLDAAGDVASAEKAESRWDRWELEQLSRVQRGLDRLLQPPGTEPVLEARLLAELGVPDFKKREARGGYEGRVARRVLETIWTRTSFYLMRELLARGQPDRAALSLAVATEINPTDWTGWYNLGCFEALAGHSDRAFAALEQAAAHGFSNRAAAEADSDLASLRGDPRYAAWLARLSS